MKRVLPIFLLFLSLQSIAISPQEKKMVEKARPYFGFVSTAYREVWQTVPMPAFVPAQIEQESLWNTQAELCVPKPSCERERGSGLGQFTVTSKFNAFDEIKTAYPKLATWAYSDRFNPEKQILAITVKDRNHYQQCIKIMPVSEDALACAAASYNGGYGGVLSDRRVCANTKGCDPTRWFNNVEYTSMKAKAKVTGYGQSFFVINRCYIYRIHSRAAKYSDYFSISPAKTKKPDPTRLSC